MTKQSHPGSLPYLSEWPFPTSSEIHFPPKVSGWKVDLMSFPWSSRTSESEFGRRSYDLPKFEVMQDPSRTEPIRGDPFELNLDGQTQPG